MGEQHARNPDDPLAAAVLRTGPATEWRSAGGIDLDFDVFHPQGMAVTDERIYLSSVEVHERPDRAAGRPGAGVGHLFVLDRCGTLLHDLEITEGDRYHPGGLDVTGDALYVPVAEYWPDSSTSLYRVDLATLAIDRLFAVDDHVGAVIADRERGRLVGHSWASRRCYEWTPGGELQDSWSNPEPTLALQDGRYVAPRMMLCSGFADDTGGLVLVDLETRRVRHRLPIQLRSASGRPMTRNPVHVEATPYAGGHRLIMYAAPDDGRGTRMYIHTADVGC